MLIKILLVLIFFWILIDIPMILYVLHCIFNKRIKKQEDARYFVSILVPCYNEEKHIEECIASILRQSYTNYELITINDGSTDRSLNKMKQAIKGAKKGKIINLKKNLGKAAALNKGLRRAKGEVIMIVDADSIIEKNGLKNILCYFREDVGVVSGNIRARKKKNDIINDFQEIEYALSQEVFRFVQGVSGNCIVVPGTFCAYKREHLKKIEEGTLSEDFDTSSKLLSKGLKAVYAEDAVAYTAIPQNMVDVICQRLRWQQGGFEVLAKHLFNFPRSSTKFWYIWFVFSVLQGSLLRVFIITLLPLYILYSRPSLLIIFIHMLYTSLLYLILLGAHNRKYEQNKVRGVFRLLPFMTIYYYSIFAFSTYLGLLSAIKGNKNWLKVKR